jgi:uncharacterized damage-inducible protein DinB
MTAQEALLHLRYSTWASRKLMDAVLALPEDQADRPTGVSHGSLLGTLGHIYLADRGWCSRMIDPSLERRTESNLELLKTDWPAIQSKWEAWAEGAQDSDLERDVTYHAMDGTAYSSPAWQIVLHVVNHATLHRGQVMGMLRQLGVKPPGTDLMYYYRELAEAAAAGS